MPRANAAVIKLARKHSRLVVVVVLAAAIIAGGLLYAQHSDSTPTATLGQTVYELEVVRTDAERERGLSGRSDLPNNMGMLFVFPVAGKHCFWMKDMQFSISMIWLDDQQKVVKIEDTARPESYPKTFCPDQDSRYVVELPAGSPARDHVTIGQVITLKHIEP